MHKCFYIELTNFCQFVILLFFTVKERETFYLQGNLALFILKNVAIYYYFLFFISPRASRAPMPALAIATLHQLMRRLGNCFCLGRSYLFGRVEGCGGQGVAYIMSAAGALVLFFALAVSNYLSNANISTYFVIGSETACFMKCICDVSPCIRRDISEFISGTLQNHVSHSIYQIFAGILFFKLFL